MEFLVSRTVDVSISIGRGLETPYKTLLHKMGKAKAGAHVRQANFVKAHVRQEQRYSFGKGPC